MPKKEPIPNPLHTTENQTLTLYPRKMTHRQIITANFQTATSPYYIDNSQASSHLSHMPCDHSD